MYIGTTPVEDNLTISMNLLMHILLTESILQEYRVQIYSQAGEFMYVTRLVFSIIFAIANFFK